MASQYNATLRAIQSSKFQFPQDCPRARAYFREKRDQTQSLVSIYRNGTQLCGPQFGKEGTPPDLFASLLEHEAVTLESGCDLIAGTPAAGPAAQQPPPPPPPPIAAAPASQQPPSPAPGAVPPVLTTPPAQAQSVPPAPVQTGLQSCAAQKTMLVAPGCNADFPQRQTGAACAAADNSVGLTLEVSGAEPTCCVTSCRLGK